MIVSKFVSDEVLAEHAKAKPLPNVSLNDARAWWSAYVQDLRREREEARRFYNADGSFVVLDSAEEVVRRRIEAAKQLAMTTAELNRASEILAESLRFPRLTFAEFQRVNRERCEGPTFGHGVMDWSPNDWATALAGEVGEACNLLKKMRRGEEVPLQKIADELADAQTYLSLLADRLGIDLERATVEKFNEVSRRRGSDVFLPDRWNETVADDLAAAWRAAHDRGNCAAQADAMGAPCPICARIGAAT